MRRRDFITLVGGAAAAWPVAARAQQPAVPVVGYLASSTETFDDNWSAFLKGLGEVGYSAGKNVAIEYRWAENHVDRLPELAVDLVRRRVAVIYVTGGTLAVLAAKSATATIPIIFTAGGDPVQRGIVSSLNRPGGNLTGTVILNSQVAAKPIGLLHELLPGATSFAMLVDTSAISYDQDVMEARAAVSAIGKKIEVFTATTNRESDLIFASLVETHADALMINGGIFFTDRRVQIVTLAARHALPVIYFSRRFVEVGGLMSYGSNAQDQIRQGGVYVGRVLQGAKPADLPVILPTRLQLVINVQTARTIGLEVPPTLLALADEVIE
jgi:putative ABC transport system substrate-binding protein